RARSRGRDANADAPTAARVPAGRVCRSGLVPNEDVANGMSVQRVVERHDRAAGVAEHDLDPFVLERLEHRVRAGAQPRRGADHFNGAPPWAARPPRVCVRPPVRARRELNAGARFFGARSITGLLPCPFGTTASACAVWRRPPPADAWTRL